MFKQTVRIGFPSAASHLSELCDDKGRLWTDAGKKPVWSKLVCHDLLKLVSGLMLLSRGNHNLSDLSCDALHVYLD